MNLDDCLRTAAKNFNRLLRRQKGTAPSPDFETIPIDVQKRRMIDDNALLTAAGMGFPAFPNGMPVTPFMEWLMQDEDEESRRSLHDWGCIDLNTGEVVLECPHPEFRTAVEEDR